MKKKKGNELEIVGTIPFGTPVWECDFVILKGGKVGEIVKVAQERGLLIIKRNIKNLSAAIRMYLIYIARRYLETIEGIKGREVEFSGEAEEIEVLEKDLAKKIKELKQKNYPKEVKKVLEELEKIKTEINKKLESIKREKIKVGEWALKKAKILIKEKERVNGIIDNLFIELIKILDICKKEKKINSFFKEFIFGENYMNLLGKIEDLKTIKEHFCDYPNDLDKLEELEKYLSNLKEKKGQKFKNTLKRMIDIMTPIVEGPIDYYIGGQKYQIFRGGVQCLTKKEEK
jgi:hypothetical protein